MCVVFLLIGFVSEKMQLLLDTMTEITHILYAKEHERCQRNILRFHNQTFLHAIACEEVIGKPIILTEKKFYGRYFHSLVCHAPIQHRIICSRSTNTEQQERHFNTFGSISLSTSSRRPGEIITPGLIRMQAEMKQGEVNGRSAIQEQESRLGKLAKCLPKPENSIIPHRIILKYQSDYQAHLERISDFLLCGKGAWWRHVAKGVEFFDVTSPSEAITEVDHAGNILPPVHHFRSHTVHSESKYLHNNWNRCVASCDIQIPHHAIRVFNENGELDHIIRTGFLDGDDDDDDDSGGSGGDEDNKSETGCDRDDSEHFGRTEDCAEKCQVQEEEQEEQEQDDDDHCHNEEDNIIALVQVGEDFLDGDDQSKELRELEEVASTETPVQLNELNVTTDETNEMHNCTNKQNSTASSLYSTLAKNVAKVIGETEDVKKLDRYRNRLRNNPKSSSIQEDYETQLAHVQMQVLRKHSQVTKIFKEWEKSFTTSNDCIEPTPHDIKKDETAYNLYKTRQLCRQLLKHWNITVHLY